MMSSIDKKDFEEKITMVRATGSKPPARSHAVRASALAVRAGRWLQRRPIARQLLTAMVCARASQLFKNADADNSGTLDQDEFHNCLKSSELGLTDTQIKDIM